VLSLWLVSCTDVCWRYWYDHVTLYSSYVVQNNNDQLTQQVESLQKKLEESEAAASKASQQYKQAQQENENAIAKFKGAQPLH